MHDPVALAQHRARIWRLCYRMTGVAADADDLVQETFARVLAQPPPDLARDPLPWLVRVATNASRDLLRRRKRTTYVGPWLPSPLPADLHDDDAAPDVHYGRAESLSYAFLIALEALGPTQRAVLILRDALGYAVSEVAELLALSAANVKTIHHRARAALADYERARTSEDAAHSAEARAAVQRLFTLFATGDAARIASALAEDVVCLTDGGGEFLAALRPIVGPERVASLLIGLGAKSTIQALEFGRCSGLTSVSVTTAHGRPRAATRGVHLFEVSDAGTIRRIYSVVATRKLTLVAV
jgi:RNA polymerase sigma factor (sigma-70 family)